jgi:Mycotoxin biosynthesis protein UstYa
METLRQWLMCQPDLTARSVVWRENGLSGAANNTISHQCIDWEALQDWIDQRTINGSHPLVELPNGMAS